MGGSSTDLISRRAFGAGLGLAGSAGLAQSKGTGGAGKVKVIDAHAHLSHHGNPGWAERDRQLMDAADRLGIDQLCCSLLTPRRPATPDDCRQANDWAAEAARRYPKVVPTS